MSTDTDRVLASRRAWLLSRQSDLRAQIDAARSALSGSLAGDAAESSDFKDQADRSGRQTVQDAEMRRDLDELAAVERVLARLDEGSDGLCIDCGQPIDVRRLAALPFAVRCIACQAASERAAAGRGTAGR